MVLVYLLGLFLVTQYAETGLAWSLVAGLGGALALAVPCALGITGASLKLLARSTLPILVCGALAIAFLYLVDQAIQPRDVVRVVWGGSTALASLLVVSLLTFGRLRGTLG